MENKDMNKIGTMCLALFVLFTPMMAFGEIVIRKFNADKDLISLHYDHAPDKDDGHSAIADRTMLEEIYGAAWLSKHVIAVSGTYGKNKKGFNTKSDAVMDVTWNDRGGWIAADHDWAAAVNAVFERWVATLKAGADVYVKEGGQSDITAAVIKRLHKQYPDIETTMRIHVVQHSNWNERQSTPEAMTYTKANTAYVRIKDANRYLNRKKGDRAFEKAATEHPVYGAAWKSAFDYYSPRKRLDFSDTGELMFILGLGEISIKEFKVRFLEEKGGRASN